MIQFNIIIISINLYDIRIPCQEPPLCYDFNDVTMFLNQEDVQKAIGVNRTWESCNMEVHLFMMGDWISSFQDDVASILAVGVRVLVYNGKYDYVCNYLGGHEWVSTMKWHGQSDFNSVKSSSWIVNGTEAGTVQAADGLTFLAVNNAGHLVPMDQPKNSLDMLDHFLKNQPF
jgi:serine carboxypeptidase-like clade 4